MKKLTILAILLISLKVSFAQKNDDKIISFLSERMMTFNKGVKIVKVNNIDSVIRSCKKKNISYTHDRFIFYRENLNMNMGGSSQTIIKNKKAPFVVYKIYKENGNTVIETVSGSDSI